jgi:hypothetical protein
MMSKIKQTTSRRVESGNTPFDARQCRIPTDAEIREVLRRSRQMQAQAIASLFTRLGK